MTNNEFPVLRQCKTIDAIKRVLYQEHGKQILYGNFEGIG